MLFLCCYYATLISSATYSVIKVYIMCIYLYNIWRNIYLGLLRVAYEHDNVYCGKTSTYSSHGKISIKYKQQIVISFEGNCNYYLLKRVLILSNRFILMHKMVGLYSQKCIYCSGINNSYDIMSTFTLFQSKQSNLPYALLQI